MAYGKLGSREEMDKERQQETGGAQVVGTQDNKAYDNADMCGKTQIARPTLREEMTKSAINHREESRRLEIGASFLHRHPEFDEFITLIRTGHIQI